ncbi:MAG: hypothetical protein N2317_08640 [Syntrophales bacterium]|nr:hypothetical protein [Syntrophales bacterium]
MRNEKGRRPVVQMSKTATVNEYYFWLCDLVNANGSDPSYNELMKALYNKTFYWSVPNDDNRAAEGRDLRERFCEETGLVYVHDYFDFHCSMLELIIALAYRCESTMADQGENMSMQHWFWKMLSNIELLDCTDEYFYNMGVPDYVDSILNRIIDRTYHRTGKGGLFPLKHPKKDQRKVELWYQMSLYLVENYYTEDVVV